MKKSVTIFVILAVGILGAYLWYHADPNIVDEEYISSDSYKALQQNIDYEKDSIVDRQMILQEVVKQMLVKEAVFQRELPYRLDSLSLDTVLNFRNRLSIPKTNLKSTGSNEYTFYGLTIFESEEYRALLSLIELPGIYRNLEVGLTTIRDGEIVDTALIGRYEKNITEKTHSEIYIGADKEIRVKLDKIRFYPFEQEKSIQYRYLIANDGRIESSIL